VVIFSVSTFDEAVDCPKLCPKWSRVDLFTELVAEFVMRVDVTKRFQIALTVNFTTLLMSAISRHQMVSRVNSARRYQ
jgi:hypothetical protein